LRPDLESAHDCRVSSPEQYDFVVVGAGPAGATGAQIAALLGKPFPGAIPFVDGETLSEVLRGVVEGSAGAVMQLEL
jgi:hypothetical protein